MSSSNVPVIYTCIHVRTILVELVVVDVEYPTTLEVSAGALKLAEPKKQEEHAHNQVVSSVSQDMAAILLLPCSLPVRPRQRPRAQ